VLFRVFGFAGCNAAFLRRCTTLLGLAARTEFFTRISSNSLVCRSRYAVRLILGYAVFLIQVMPGTFNAPDNTSQRVQPPSRESPNET
jgi:hypothetical protein